MRFFRLHPSVPSSLAHPGHPFSMRAAFVRGRLAGRHAILSSSSSSSFKHLRARPSAPSSPHRCTSRPAAHVHRARNGTAKSARVCNMTAPCPQLRAGSRPTRFSRANADPCSSHPTPPLMGCILSSAWGYSYPSPTREHSVEAILASRRCWEASSVLSGPPPPVPAGKRPNMARGTVVQYQWG